MSEEDAKAITSMKYLLEDVMEYWDKRIDNAKSDDEVLLINDTVNLWHKEESKKLIRFHDRVRSRLWQLVAEEEGRKAGR